MKESAVEFLIEQLDNNLDINHSWRTRQYIEQAKEMENEQHQETFKQSRSANIFEKDMPPVWESWEQYYNATFKQQEQ
jgi:hypothetical protein